MSEQLTYEQLKTVAIAFYYYKRIDARSGPSGDQFDKWAESYGKELMDKTNPYLLKSKLEKMIAESFEGWSQESEKGYLTAVYTILHFISPTPNVEQPSNLVAVGPDKENRLLTYEQRVKHIAEKMAKLDLPPRCESETRTFSEQINKNYPKAMLAVSEQAEAVRDACAGQYQPDGYDCRDIEEWLIDNGYVPKPSRNE